MTTRVKWLLLALLVSIILWALIGWAITAVFD
jgi:hypothetical protein